MGSKRTPRGKKSKGALLNFEAPDVQWVHEEPTTEQNGWQLNHTGVKARIGSLYNCWTLCDVVFELEDHALIPGHKTVLASASPVFFRMFSSENFEQQHVTSYFRSDSQLSGEMSHSLSEAAAVPWPRVQIHAVPRITFLEFLRFLYLDEVNITLGNFMSLVILAETYKVVTLSVQLFQFLRGEVQAMSALQVLPILRQMLGKVVVASWRAFILQRKEQRRFKELSLSDRREALISKLHHDPSRSLLASPRRSGGLGQARPLTPRGLAAGSGAAPSTAGSVRRRFSLISAQSLNVDSRNTDTPVNANDDLLSEADTMDLVDAAVGFKKRIQEDTVGSESIFLSSGGQSILDLVQELDTKCWRCMQEETEQVLSCKEFWEQDIAMLREILRLDICSVPEIVLFRAVNEWATRQCSKLGTTPTFHNRREVLGAETIFLIRFPVMSLEQFQWEVVPTGLLTYDEVKSLLDAMTGRLTNQSAFTVFSCVERKNLQILSVRLSASGDENACRSMTASLAESATHFGIYKADSTDAVDTMLSAELFRTRLQKKVPRVENVKEVSSHDFDQEDQQVNVQKQTHTSGVKALQPTRGLLPPIGERQTPAAATKLMLMGQSQTQLRLILQSYHQEKESKVCLGQPDQCETPDPADVHIDPAAPRPSAPLISPVVSILQPEESVLSSISRSTAATMLSQQRARRPVPSDFERISEGLYRFRGDRLLEVWVEAGEPMVLDHGQHPKLGFGGLGKDGGSGSLLGSSERLVVDDVAEELLRNSKQARAFLGLSPRPPRGQGISLKSFLCRQ